MKAKILVVEDEEPLRENIVTLLTEENYEVVSAENGFKAEELAFQFKPDLIISDIVMRGRNGFELLKILQQNEITRKVPVVFLSARVEREHVREGMEAGADDYLLKPYKKEELLSAIDARLKKFSMLNNEKNPKDEVPIEPIKYNLDERIFFEQKGDIGFIKIVDIKYIKADNQYTELYLINGKSVLLHKPLREWEEKLPENNFIKISRSIIICIDHIQKIEKWFNSSYKIKLVNETEDFVVSKRLAGKLRLFN